MIRPPTAPELLPSIVLFFTVIFEDEFVPRIGAWSFDPTRKFELVTVVLLPLTTTAQPPARPKS
ncbi:hypothetical protein D3C87_1909290 [compost metagenome]